MLLSTTRSITLALLALFVVVTPLVFAAEGDAGKGSVEFGLGYYENSDGSNGEEGNPFLDEESTIVEPVIVFDYNISDETAVWAKFSYDYVSCASIERLSNFPEQSGASGDNYLSVEGGLRRTLDRQNAWGVFGHFSAEYDYVSIGLGGDYTRTAPDGNSSIKYALNGFVDSMDLIRYNGVEEGSDNRITLTAQVNAYQVMDPMTHAEYGGVLTMQSGYLSTPYNAVVIEDTLVPNTNLVDNAPGREVVEELEDSLIRGAVFGRLRRSLAPRHAVELGGRLYADSWGMTGISAEPRWYHWLIDGKLRMRLRYRFYTQSETDAFSEHFLVEEQYRTQDSDLGAFTSQTLGGLLTLLTGEASEYDLALDYITRDDGIDQVLARFAYRWDF